MTLQQTTATSDLVASWREAVLDVGYCVVSGRVSDVLMEKGGLVYIFNCQNERHVAPFGATRDHRGRDAAEEVFATPWTREQEVLLGSWDDPVYTNVTFSISRTPGSIQHAHTFSSHCFFNDVLHSEHDVCPRLQPLVDHTPLCGCPMSIPSDELAAFTYYDEETRYLGSRMCAECVAGCSVVFSTDELEAMHYPAPFGNLPHATSVQHTAKQVVVYFNHIVRGRVQRMVLAALYPNTCRPRWHPQGTYLYTWYRHNDRMYLLQYDGLECIARMDLAMEMAVEGPESEQLRVFRDATYGSRKTRAVNAGYVLEDDADAKADDMQYHTDPSFLKNPDTNALEYAMPMHMRLHIADVISTKIKLGGVVRDLQLMDYDVCESGAFTVALAREPGVVLLRFLVFGQSATPTCWTQVQTPNKVDVAKLHSIKIRVEDKGRRLVFAFAHAHSSTIVYWHR